MKKNTGHDNRHKYLYKAFNRTHTELVKGTNICEESPLPHDSINHIWTVTGDVMLLLSQGHAPLALLQT